MSQTQSEAMRQRWANPAYKERMSKTMSKAMKKYYKNPEARKRNSEAIKKAYKNPEARKRLAEAKKKAWADPELRKRITKALKKYFEDPESRERASKALKKAYANPEVKKRLAKTWANPKLREKRAKAIKKAYRRPEVLAKFCGPNASNWKGGISTAPYCWNWKVISEFIRDRDLGRCALCWSTKHPQAHHINFVKENCPPENAITLCPTCHGKTTGFKGEEIRIASMEIFYPMLKDLYGYKYAEDWSPLPEEKMKWPQNTRRLLLAKKYTKLFEKALSIVSKGREEGQNEGSPA